MAPPTKSAALMVVPMPLFSRSSSARAKTMDVAAWMAPSRILQAARARAACRILEGAIQAATSMVFALAELDREKSGMGTTISAALFVGGAIVIGQVGNSRVYRIRGREAVQLTEDHTLIAWQIKQGLI